MNVARYLALAEHSERRLGEALMLFSDRHGDDAELSHLARVLSGWSSLHAQALAPWRTRYGRALDPDPDRLRDALFHDPRVGGVGLARDLHDLWLLAQSVHMCWTALAQAAKAAKELQLKELCDRCGAQTNQQLAWIRTHFSEVTAQALTVPQETLPKLRSAIPFKKRPASLPDGAWAPFAGAVLVLIVGAAGLLAGQAWLVPSLGPSAYLVGENAAHPSARAYNVLAGHVIGLGAGFVGVWSFAANADPAVLQAGAITGRRLGAAVIATLIAMVFAALLRASHPPAAATTLLVALGSISTGAQALDVVVGAAILAVAGEGLRALRMGKLRARKARAEARQLRATEWVEAPADVVR
jgi:hypothetical protein